MEICSRDKIGGILTLLMVIFSHWLGADIKDLSAQEIQKKADYYSNHNDQDGPNIDLGNPLKEISRFNFYAWVPAENKTFSDKVNVIVEQKLKQFGKLNKLELILETETGPAIDLSGFDGGVTLIYQIKDISSLEGKDLGIVRASLSLSEHVIIEKTQEESSAYIWSCNCFLKGDTEKNLENSVRLTLEYLLQRFSTDYSAVNSGRPIFNFYTP